MQRHERPFDPPEKKEGGGSWGFGFALLFRVFVPCLTLLVYKLHFLVFVALAKSESEQMQWIEEKNCAILTNKLRFLVFVVTTKSNRKQMQWVQDCNALF